MKSKLIAVMLLAAGTVFAQFSIGIRIGGPPAPRAMRAQPRSPGADYAWIAGYWYPVNNRYKWHDGYWTRPAYAGAHWVAPHHDGDRFFEGYWDGDRGRSSHDHRSDRGRGSNRDYNHGPDQH